jgi:hypothetical protein
MSTANRIIRCERRGHEALLSGSNDLFQKRQSNRLTMFSPIPFDQLIPRNGVTIALKFSTRHLFRCLPKKQGRLENQFDHDELHPERILVPVG